ncbi:uncharacterized protein LOC127836321 isoform X1 [Dreissena polymorpha]|nr:uncharacterized protein LOC127836321 isoform X1 [Dreissena polymorpha]
MCLFLFVFGVAAIQISSIFVDVKHRVLMTLMSLPYCVNQGSSCVWDVTIPEQDVQTDHIKENWRIDEPMIGLHYLRINVNKAYGRKRFATFIFGLIILHDSCEPHVTSSWIGSYRYSKDDFEREEFQKTTYDASSTEHVSQKHMPRIPDDKVDSHWSVVDFALHNVTKLPSRSIDLVSFIQQANETRSKKQTTVLADKGLCMSACLQRAYKTLIDARAYTCKTLLKVLHIYVPPICALTVPLKRLSCEEFYLCPHYKRHDYRFEPRQNLQFRMMITFPNVIDVSTALSCIINEWRIIFKRKLHEYTVRNASGALTSTLCHRDEVKLFNRTETSNRRFKTNNAIFSHTFLNSLTRMLQFACCTYDRPAVPDRTADIYIYHIRLSILVYVIYLRCTCICLCVQVLTLLQLNIHRLSRPKQTNHGITVCMCDTEIPIKFSIESSSSTKIQPLYAWNKQGSFIKATSCKTFSQKDNPEDTCKKDVDCCFEEKNKHTENDFLATMLRRNTWLLSHKKMYGLPTPIWVFPLISPVITIINRLAEGSSVHPKESMRHELLRLCTFRTYPTHGKPSCLRLAKAGFYYASQGDEVICYCCAKRISNWNERDDPLRAHRLVSPGCPFLLRNSEVNEPVTDDSSESSNPRLNRILQSLDDSDEPPDRRGTENVSAAIPDVSSLSATTSSRTTEHATNVQNGVSGYSGECRSGPFTHELTATTNRTVGESQLTSAPVPPARSSIPAGSFACSSATEASIATPNARREMAMPMKAEGRQLQGASNNRSDETREKLLSENRALKAQSKCLRCRRNDVCIAFLPCGHLVSCEACSTDPSARKCFSCDAAVKARIKAFIA